MLQMAAARCGGAFKACSSRDHSKDGCYKPGRPACDAVRSSPLQIRADRRPALHIHSASPVSSSIGPLDRSSSISTSSSIEWLASLQRAAAGAAVAAAATAALALGGPLLPAAAAPQKIDSGKVGVCLLSKCQAALAGCLGDPECLADLVCLQLCDGTEDETACQIKCGDRYSDDAVNAFNSCVISEQQCVPQRVDEGLYPVPPASALDPSFDLPAFQGRWYISAGLNPLFDTFDCQAHFFAVPEPGKLYAKINWRIPRGTIDFIERSTMQRFVQVPDQPALLLNHDNEFLHYQDDWYILASKPDQYVFVYYRGQNDAWKGYGGATVYTRAPSLPEEYVPELRAAAERAGLDWGAFALTDNSCGPHPTQAQLETAGRQQLEADIKEAEGAAAASVQQLESALEDELTSFGRGFTVLEQDLEGLEQGIIKEGAELEEALAREVQQAARMIRRFEMEARMGTWVKVIPQWLRPIIMPMP